LRGENEREEKGRGRHGGLGKKVSKGIDWGWGFGGWEMGNGKWEMGNGKWEMGNGKWEMGNGKWEMGNGKWEMGKEGRGKSVER